MKKTRYYFICDICGKELILSWNWHSDERVIANRIAKKNGWTIKGDVVCCPEHKPADLAGEDMPTAIV